MTTVISLSLLHFLWQGLLIGVVAFIAMKLARQASARYVIGLAALGVMFAAPLLTAAMLVQGSRGPEVQGSTLSAVNVERQIADSPMAPIAEPNNQIARFPNNQIPSRVSAAVLWVWLIGVAALSIRLAGGWLTARRLTRVGFVAPGLEVRAQAARVAAQLMITRTIRIVESSLVEVPTVIGWLKPVVLLPAAAMTGLTMGQVEALLAHELAHIKRHDYVVNLIQSAIETLLFYHPMVWLVSRRVRQERELCCDDIALQICTDKLTYASALADLESLRAAPSPALAATGGSLLARITRILGREDRSGGRAGSSWAAGVAILTLALIAVPANVARTKASDAPQTTQVTTQSKPVSPTTVVQPSSNPITTPNNQITRSPDNQIQGVAAGVPGGVQAGVPGGVQGGIGISPGLEALLSGPSPHIVGVGDVIGLRVTSGQNQSLYDKDYTVQNDGTIVLPEVGPVKVIGLTLAKSAAAVKETLIDLGQFSNPTVTIMLDRFRPAQPQPQGSGSGISSGRVFIPEAPKPVATLAVLVKGAVRSPGIVNVPEGNANVAQVIVLARGITADAASIVLSRNAPGAPASAAAVELYTLQALADGALARVAVKAGDEISVPVQKRNATVTVQGAVRTPGPHTLSDTETFLPMAIFRAGGVNPDAEAITIRRPNPNGETIETYTKADLQAGKLDAIRVGDGDRVVIQAPVRPIPLQQPTNVKQIPDYVIGPADVVRIHIVTSSLQPAFTKSYAVQNDGAIYFPDTGVGAVRVAGLTLAQAQAEIAQRFIDAKVSQSPTVVLTMEQYRSSRVIVQGAVRTPGAVLLQADRMTLPDAIAKAGGLTAIAGPTLTVRNGAGTAEYLKADFVTGKLDTVRINAGDSINVAVGGQVRVNGLVRKSGTYDWQPGMTISDAIALAGGLDAAATMSRVQLHRKVGDKYVQVKLNSDISSTRVEPGDVIEVPRRRM
jgi:protein involved in polysaccharide export with SLBB domain/beta-lactamase regulating signal transducer with metallopeptidase domain